MTGLGWVLPGHPYDHATWATLYPDAALSPIKAKKSAVLLSVLQLEGETCMIGYGVFERRRVRYYSDLEEATAVYKKMR